MASAVRVGVLTALGLSAVAGGCRSAALANGGTVVQAVQVPAAALPRTRAERTNYLETSSQADVVAFIDSLNALGAKIVIGTLATTAQGRNIPYVIASRPLVRTPAEARRLNRPIIYVQGNIHSGEVEGKEALQAILRDLVFSPTPNALDSIVLIAVPNYNADGNENLAAQARARGSQQGPEMVGTRPNSMGLNLNRDYMKADAPETRGSLDLFNAWDPDIYLDLHTSNGSLHGYALTYSPSLNPAAFFGGVYARDVFLPEIRNRMRSRHNFETFDYGNFSAADTTGRWSTYEHVPRFGSNYYGVRGRIGLLSEAYSHDPFQRRVASTYAFVKEILSLAAERSREIRALSQRADQQTTAWGSDPILAPAIPIRAVLTRTPFKGDILVEDIVRDRADTVRYEAGLPPGTRRTGVIRPVRMTIADRFDATLTRPMPRGYVLDESQGEAARMLKQHGITVQRLDAVWSTPVEVFIADSVLALQTFEGHRMAGVRGRWTTKDKTFRAGSYLVSTAQPRGILAVYLLEPESDDGLLTWNFFDRSLQPNGEVPVARVMGPLTTRAKVER